MKNENVKLEKKLSPLNVWSLALGCIIGWGAFVMPGNTFLGKAGPLGTAIAMGIAALIMIIIAFNYNFMISKYPVAGGEFTYTQRRLVKTCLCMLMVPWLVLSCHCSVECNCSGSDRPEPDEQRVPDRISLYGCRV